MKMLLLLHGGLNLKGFIMMFALVSPMTSAGDFG